LRALSAQIEGLASREPGLMLFEDTQWSDPASLELLDQVVDRVPPLRLLLIVAFRRSLRRGSAGRTSWRRSSGFCGCGRCFRCPP